MKQAQESGPENSNDAKTGGGGGQQAAATT